MDRLQASSISRHVLNLVRPAPSEAGGRPLVACVLACFNRACNLVTAAGDVVALVTPEIGDGPLNVVVPGAADALQLLQVDHPAVSADDCLLVGPLRVSLKEAILWEPCPDWEALRGQADRIVRRLSELEEIAVRLAATQSWLGLSPAHREWPAASQAIQALEVGWKGDRAHLLAGATGLAGLGGGLTPAGDDFLAGLMLWAWLAHPAPLAFNRTLVEAAATRTTTLAAAWLRAAATGACSAGWHRLLAALMAGERLEPAVRQVLACGATSGADTLAGFIWLASRPSLAQ